MPAPNAYAGSTQGPFAVQYLDHAPIGDAAGDSFYLAWPAQQGQWTLHRGTSDTPIENWETLASLPGWPEAFVMGSAGEIYWDHHVAEGSEAEVWRARLGSPEGGAPNAAPDARLVARRTAGYGEWPVGKVLSVGSRGLVWSDANSIALLPSGSDTPRVLFENTKPGAWLWRPRVDGQYAYFGVADETFRIPLCDGGAPEKLSIPSGLIAISDDTVYSAHESTIWRMRKF